MLNNFTRRGAVAMLSVGLLAAPLTLLTGAASSSAGATMLPRCMSDQMRVSVGPTSSAFLAEGRRSTTPIIFTNSGSACTIWGTPTMLPVRGATHAWAAPAAWNQSIGMMGAIHVVAKGASVSSTFTNNVYFSLATCRVGAVDGLVVSVPTFVRPSYVALPVTVCTGITATTTRLLNNGRAG